MFQLPHVTWTHKELSGIFPSIQDRVPDLSGYRVYGAHLSPWLQSYSWVSLPFSVQLVMLVLRYDGGTGCFSLELSINISHELQGNLGEIFRVIKYSNNSHSLLRLISYCPVMRQRPCPGRLPNTFFREGSARIPGYPGQVIFMCDEDWTLASARYQALDLTSSRSCWIAQHAGPIGSQAIFISAGL